MLGFLILTGLVGVGMSMGGSDDEVPETDQVQDQGRYPEWAARDENATDILGDAADDLLVGGPVDSTIEGNGGDDVLNGLGLDDTLYGGDGDDTLYGATGNDLVVGGPGDDVMILGGGDDVVDSAFGTDEMVGNDTIYGQNGDDTIVDVDGANHITGDNGNDILMAIDGASPTGDLGTAAESGTTDTLDGGAGNDTLFGDDGDLMTGDGDADTFIIGTTLGGGPAAPVEITDFTVEDDVFVVSFLDAPEVATDVTYDHDPEANHVTASVNGQVVAHLRGLTADDIPLIETAFVA